MSESSGRDPLRDAIKHRALLYFYFFDELRQEVGEQKAAKILKRAIYRRGAEVGQALAGHAPDDMAGLKDAFLGSIPGGDAYFSPEVERCDEDGVDITLHSCPLLEAWQEAGIAEDDIAKIAEIAGVIDNGTFEGAGFGFSSETWKPHGHLGCCHLHIRPKKE